jgi:hypothetical protein
LSLVDPVLRREIRKIKLTDNPVDVEVSADELGAWAATQDGKVNRVSLASGDGASTAVDIGGEARHLVLGANTNCVYAVTPIDIDGLAIVCRAPTCGP